MSGKAHITLGEEVFHCRVLGDI